MNNLLSDGADAATSATQTLAGGQVLHLVGASRGPVPTYWEVIIEHQMSDGGWSVVSKLRWDAPMAALFGVGNFRLQRVPGARCIVDGEIA